ncbi:cytidine deaminase [bacterium]|nr:cytidine deaminase [bacterium]
MLQATDPTYQSLLTHAKKAQQLAKASYSNFSVGAALLDNQGKIWSGCNVESSSYGLSCCAERVALFKALSEGADIFTHILIIADTEEPTPPCGACRQLLQDYASSIEVHLHSGVSGKHEGYLLQELYPHPFDDGKLNGGGK